MKRILPEIVDPGCPVTSLRGIGPSKARALERLGIRYVRDLALFQPRYHIDLRNPDRLDRCTAGQRVTVLCRLESFRGSVVKGKNLYTVKADITCCLSGTSGSARWFAAYKGRPPVWLSKRLEQGERYILRGLAEVGTSGGIVISNPVLTIFAEDREDSLMLAVYPGTAGLRQAEMRKLIRTCLEALAGSDDGLGTYGGMGFVEALRALHNPENPALAEKARRRLALGEYCAFRNHRSEKRGKAGHGPAPDFSLGSDYAASVLSSLPFALTDGQALAWTRVKNGLASGEPMDMLLQGDVGCGKTAVAVLACAMALGAGYQVAFLSPTEILANQLFRNLEGLLGADRVRLLTAASASSAAKRKMVMQGLDQGIPMVMVGTHSILSQGVTFGRLGLAVVDEQHRFGVSQREALLGRGSGVHCLSLSATPIPRSLALGFFGDVEMNAINSMPPGRMPVETKWVPASGLESVYAFVQRCIHNGGRAYILCPSIDPPDPGDVDENGDETGVGQDCGVVQDFSLSSQVVMVASALSRVAGPGGVAVVHGRMSQSEKETAMEAFRSGESKILVCTTVVEVGVDVPEANTIVILGAERFGLAQLHQLRGRVGRGDLRSYCILVSDGRTPLARERLDALRSTSDGFMLADMDLRLRGPGEFAGLRQHGVPEFRIFRFPDDLDALHAIGPEVLLGNHKPAQEWYAFEDEGSEVCS